MTRDEILSANPLAAWLKSRGIELFANDSVTHVCAKQEHKRGHRCVTITGNLWHCNDCDVGGTIIDWLIHEKNMSAKDALASFDTRPAPAVQQAKPIVTAIYPYTDAEGKLLYEVIRTSPKGFKQRRPDGNGGWIWGLGETERVLYRLPELKDAKEIWFVEGEKDADNLRGIGFFATTASGGAENIQCSLEPLKGKDVILCGDNDSKGEAHATKLADMLNGVAKSVRRVRVPVPHKDISDYIKASPDAVVAAEGCRVLLMDAITLSGPLMRPLADLVRPEPGDPNELIRHRYLCRGGIHLFVAPSGIGKSVFVMQCAILWTLGREAFWMKPTRPLKVVIIQAENDDGDMAEMRDGVVAGMNLTEDERGLVFQMVQVRHEQTMTGAAFCKLVARILKESGADIIIIDPAFAYLGGNASEQEVVTSWLRNHLMPVLVAHKAAAIIVHHTNKPPSGKEKQDWQAGDLSYLGSGSAEWTNAARSVMAIQSIGSHNVFRLVAAKRGKKLAWRDENDEPMFERYLAHSTQKGVLCWREATPEEVASVNGKAMEQMPAMDDFLKLFPDKWNGSARSALMSRTELRAKLVAAGIRRKWERDLLSKATCDRLLMGLQSGNGREVLYGRPEAVKAWSAE